MFSSIPIRFARNFSKVATTLKLSEPISYSRVLPDRFQDVIEHLRFNFFPHEPISKSLSLCEPGEPQPEMEAYSFNILQQGMSIMASVAGVCLAGLPNKEIISGKFKDPKLIKMFSFLRGFSHKLNLDTSNMIHLYGLSVDEKLRGQGVGEKIHEFCEVIAKEHGAKLLFGEATSVFTAKILLKLGWETIKEVKYSEYPNKEEPMFNIEPPHEAFKIMIKRLN